MLSWKQSSEAFEKEGVFIGGWSLRHAIVPEKVNGVHNSSEDRAVRLAVVSDWDAAEERRLVRKLDMRVMLPCCIIYFLAYMDRANLGNIAILQKGTDDSLSGSLGLKKDDFNWSVSITYFSVTALLMPANILMKKISAKVYFPLIMVLWGIVVMSLAGVKSKAGLLAGRFMLGVPEAGVVPCCVMYFSFWYKPTERAIRLGIFHSANSLALACSGFAAIGINHLNDVRGLKSWQWVFIIEGLLPIVMAAPIFFLLLTFPETTTALTERERYIAINRFGRGATRMTDLTWDWAAFRRIFTRPSTYVFFTSYVSLTIVAVAQATFLPTILTVFLEFSVQKSNLYTAIVNLSCIPIYWIWPFHSDWTRERMWHYLIPISMAIPCYGVWTYVSVTQSTKIPPIAMYGMAFLGQMVVISQPIVLSYRTSTLYGAAEQAVGGAAAVASLSIASIIAPQIYPAQDAPRYLPGFSATCGILALCILSYATLPVWLLLEAKRRKAKTGHALPLQAMEDMENSQVSAAMLNRVHEINAMEEMLARDLEEEKVGTVHIEETK
ncbi:hypothetical protein B7463_g10159, partial [Scytalidium lignicola]